MYEFLYVMLIIALWKLGNHIYRVMNTKQWMCPKCTLVITVNRGSGKWLDEAAKKHTKDCGVKA